MIQVPRTQPMMIPIHQVAVQVAHQMTRPTPPILPVVAEVEMVRELRMLNLHPMIVETTGTPDAQPPSYDCGNYKQSVDWHTWHTGTSNSKSTSTCANGVRWRNFKTDKKAYVQGETVNYEYEIQVKEWNPTRCGDTGCCLYRWKQCWFSPDDDGSMGKNDSDATWGVTFFDSQGSQMHKLRTAGATGRAYKTAEYLKIKGSFVIPNSAGAIGQWKANVFAMIPAYENNLYVDCGDLKAEENDIRVFYCYAKECKETSSAETFGAESSLWQSSFSNQSFMAF